MARVIELKVTGMTCDHCVNAVTEALKGVEGVQDAMVSLEDNAAKVSGDAVESQKLIDAIVEEGYEASVTA
ncbi:MAG TPA: cation transporter [Dehalococcoidia bacterium]|nr:cation transporter [Dehalococcoidia bacterium]